MLCAMILKKKSYFHVHVESCLCLVLYMHAIQILHHIPKSDLNCIDEMLYVLRNDAGLGPLMFQKKKLDELIVLNLRKQKMNIYIY